MHFIFIKRKIRRYLIRERDDNKLTEKAELLELFLFNKKIITLKSHILKKQAADLIKG